MFYNAKIRLSLLHAPPAFLERSTGFTHAQIEGVVKAFLVLDASIMGRTCKYPSCKTIPLKRLQEIWNLLSIPPHLHGICMQQWDFPFFGLTFYEKVCFIFESDIYT
jgi:hypothetical protein